MLRSTTEASIPAAGSSPGVGLFVICLVAVSMRLPLGVDLGDEAYYAVFVDGWRKGGVADSPFLMLHQTSALLVYPLARLLGWLGGDSGLLLQLRIIWLLMLSACAWLVRAVLGRAVGFPMSSLLAAGVLLFIPFGLPAPSYNTIGLLGLLAGLSALAWAGLDACRDSREDWRGRGLGEGLSRVPSSVPAWVGACVSSVAVIAYPPLLLPVVASFVLVACAPAWQTRRAWLWRQAVIFAIVMIGSGFLLLAVRGPSTWWQVLAFTSDFNNVAQGLGGKLRATQATLAAHPRMAYALAIALASTVLRAVPGTWPRNVGDLLLASAMVLVATQAQAAFYSRSHELVLLVAVAGAGPACRAVAGRDSVASLLGACTLASLLAGLTTAASAFNGAFNFAIGGFAAAVFGLCLPVAHEDRWSASRAAVTGLFCALLAVQSLTQFYGQVESVSYRRGVSIESGAFAGLRTDPQQAAFVDAMQAALAELRPCGARLAVISTGPGFYLMGRDYEPTALAAWSFPGRTENAASRAIDAYYADPRHRPDVLVVNRWQWASAQTPGETALLHDYRRMRDIDIGIHHASLFARTDRVDGAGRACLK